MINTRMMMTLLEASVEIDGLFERLDILDSQLDELDDYGVKMPDGWSSALYRFRDCLKLAEEKVIDSANAECRRWEALEERERGKA